MVARLPQAYNEQVFAAARIALKRDLTILEAAVKMQVSRDSVNKAKAILTVFGEDGAIAVLSDHASLSGKYSEATSSRKKSRVQSRHRGQRQSQHQYPRPHSRSVFLRPQEVDPEFTGSPIDFIDKYGHVQTETALQRASHRFTAWRQNITSLAKTASKLPDWPKVDHNWLRDPNPNDIAKLAEALAVLRPRIDEAEALLQCAQQRLNGNNAGNGNDANNAGNGNDANNAGNGNDANDAAALVESIVG